MSEPFVYRHRVRFHECDAQAIMFNAHYVTLLDVALTELFRDRLVTIPELKQRGYETVVVDVHVAWKSSARFDDEIELAVAVDRMGTTSMTLGFTHTVDGRLCAEGQIVHVWIDPTTRAPTPIPDFARAALA